MLDCYESLTRNFSSLVLFPGTLNFVLNDFVTDVGFLVLTGRKTPNYCHLVTSPGGVVNGSPFLYILDVA